MAIHNPLSLHWLVDRQMNRDRSVAIKTYKAAAPVAIPKSRFWSKRMKATAFEHRKLKGPQHPQ
jgi:hypothetical protein